MKYKHIVFDIDGTLIDTEYAVINSLIKTITEITGRAPQYESLKFALGALPEEMRWNYSKYST